MVFNKLKVFIVNNNKNIEALKLRRKGTYINKEIIINFEDLNSEQPNIEGEHTIEKV
jgi:hypothetical protein